MFSNSSTIGTMKYNNAADNILKKNILKPSLNLAYFDVNTFIKSNIPIIINITGTTSFKIITIILIISTYVSPI